MPSPAGWREVPCVECGAFVEGIDFVQRCGSCQQRRVKRAMRIARWAAIGPTTQSAMQELLGEPVLVARESSLEALAEVLV